MIGELELAWRLLPNEFVAVTGTNGKTTTVELIGAIHRAAGLRRRRRRQRRAGAEPCSRAAAARRRPARSGDDVVCEASSFQLEDTVAFAPHAAVLLNIAPDHLDRHGDMDAYVAAKLRAVRAPGQPSDLAVAPGERRRRRCPGCGARLTFGSERRRRPAPRRRAGCGGAASGSSRSRAIRLRGAAQPRERDGGGRGRAGARRCRATACARRSRASPASRTASRRWRASDGVLYVNDSKATNVASTLVALRVVRAGQRASDPRRPRQGRGLRAAARGGRARAPARST